MKTPLIALFLALPPASASAQVHNSQPQPLPLPPPIEAPRDVPYPGLLTLSVDASDLNRRIYRARETIPVRPGPMTLLYAQWQPGEHKPSGPLYNFSGLKITAGGKPVAWTRDTVDVYAFHLVVPEGAASLDVEADYLTPIDRSQGPPAMTPEMLRLYWFNAALYPAGYFTRDIQIEASIKLPPGFDFATALDGATRSGDVVTFAPTSYETLGDSPLIAGRYFKKVDLDPGGKSRVTLNIAADAPEKLEIRPEVLAAHREMVRQMGFLYGGTRHYDHYDFLFTLSDRLAGAGVEHQRSSDNGTTPNYFTRWDTEFTFRDTLAHEYNHSWDGKYRRPADLWTANFNTPMRDSLLWVYEGQTQYWGNVITARAGMATRQQALDSLAAVAAQYDQGQPGRNWRPLQDTTNDPIVAQRRAIPWSSYQRSEDYYREGQLLWLDADTLIRERSNNRRSLDDFAKAFFGMNDGDWGQLTYRFEDVVQALNKVEPYDWATFLRSHLDGAPVDALAGIRRGGYRLVYGEELTALGKQQEAVNKTVGMTYSLGASFDARGKIISVIWDGPVFRAGLTTGVTVLAVNGQAFDGDRLRAAVKASKAGGEIEFLYRQGDDFNTVKLDYHGGLRYARLERVAGTPDLLDDILSPRTR